MKSLIKRLEISGRKGVERLVEIGDSVSRTKKTLGRPGERKMGN